MVSGSELVAAEKSSPLAPTTTSGRLRATLSNQIGSIDDEIRIDAKDGEYRSLDLLVRIVFATKSTR